jgi:hypothetical protein
MAIATILLLLALLCFILAAFGVASRVNLTDVGLALFVLSILAGSHAL